MLGKVRRQRRSSQATVHWMRRPSKADLAVALGVVAVFTSAGGPSWAAGKITGEQIKDETLTGADVQNDSLTGADIVESSLGEIPAAGGAGVRNRSVAERGSDSQLSEDEKSASAQCPAGKVVVGGGHAIVAPPALDLSIVSSRPGSTDRWSVTAEEDTPTDFNWQLSAYAVCVDAE